MLLLKLSDTQGGMFDEASEADNRVPRCRGRSQDAANSSRFLTINSRLRAVRYEMVAEGEELETNLLQGKPA